AAHFEPDLVVINLTKTQGAGSLAHEWFHALDNYFNRMRGEKYEHGYVTEWPEQRFVFRNTMHTRAYLEEKRQNRPNDSFYAEANWVPDPTHPLGVRPEMEAAFGRLVDALDRSPMAERAKLNDKGRKEYWGKTIERAARAFENYVITKLDERGHHNDYLANVVPPADFIRASGRYPYLLPEEMPPVKEAFDNLFATVEQRETDKGVALFSLQGNGTPADEAEANRRLWEQRIARHRERMRTDPHYFPSRWEKSTDYNLQQRRKGAETKVARQRAMLEKYSNPQTPREKAGLTTATKNLRAAQLELDRITNYLALRERRKQAPDAEQQNDVLFSRTENHPKEETHMPATKPFIRSEDRQIVQELHQSFDKHHPIPENYVINTVEPDNRTVIIPGEWNGHAEVFADNIDDPESYGVYVESRFDYGYRRTKVADFHGDEGLFSASVLTNRLGVISANSNEAMGRNTEVTYKQLVAEQAALNDWQPKVERPAISDEDMRTAQAIRAREIQRLLSVSTHDEDVRFAQKSAREGGIPFGEYTLPGDCELGAPGISQLDDDEQSWDVFVERYAREAPEIIASFTGEDARTQVETLYERLRVIAAYAEIRPLRQRERFAQLLASRERQAEQTQAAPQPAPHKP
ncbi:MAG: hypothetical protein IKU14_08590, partial [Rhodocyclaceae bacterium]|nr:hypothetical protein [Rhodocyclaceae bacterium]